MTSSDDYEFICSAKEAYPQLSHASNIITKYQKTLNSKERAALTTLIPEYATYLGKMLSVTTYDQISVYKKVEYLNAYYGFMRDNNLDGAFSAQGKFRPTILEEFLYLLFKDYVAEIKQAEDDNNVLGSGAVKAYSNIYFTAKNFRDFVKFPVIGVNEKDQDYAIYRTFCISINESKPLQIQIPAIAIEAKTYIDKTMLDSIIATAEKIKSGNPHARFVAVTERYDVSFAVDPAYSRIDQIYVLRKSLRKKGCQEIDKAVVWRLFSETVAHLARPWSDIETKIKEDGIVI